MILTSWSLGISVVALVGTLTHYLTTGLREHKRQVRAQAELVAVWMEESDGDRETQEGAGTHVRLANWSKLPIYNVQVVVESSNYPPRQFERLHVLGPDRKVTMPWLQLFEPAYNKAAEIKVPEGRDPTINEIHGNREWYWGTGGMRGRVSFKDAAGKIWRRNAEGVLKQVRE